MDRGRAIRLLGFDESRDVRVLAVSADVPATLRLVLGALSGGRVATATLGRTVAVLYPGGPAARPLGDAIEAAIAAAYPAPRTRPGDRGPWVGIGSETGIFAAPKSWSEALGALRFASSTGYGRHVVAYERLGVLELLARLPAERIAANHDIARINEIKGARTWRSSTPPRPGCPWRNDWPGPPMRGTARCSASSSSI
ncbi:MAG: hypothetical protein KDB70_06840 [Mycobacterium sp.]|nr:hypothetical protein [Mycobacterium sp.]